MPLTSDDFRSLPILDGVREDVLEWLAEHCRESLYEDGALVAKMGDPAEEMIFVLEGQLDIVARDRTRLTQRTGDVSGKLPFSRMAGFPGTVTASGRTRLARLHEEHFGALLRRCDLLETRLIHLMSDRIRDVTRLSLQQEKLLGLGTMAAGLAHELNNPASAAQSSARHLVEVLSEFNLISMRALAPAMFRDYDPAADAAPFQPLLDAMALDGKELDTLERGDREDELAPWLEEMGVEDPWEVAPLLVEVGYTRAFLEDFAARLRPESVATFLTWLSKDVELRRLTGELAEATDRISSLIAAMKSYSYMDRALDKAPVDLHEGLEVTLRILGHKLRRKGIDVVREFGQMPPVPAVGGELNQVWTNLLDNAVDALPESGGRITIRTRMEGDCALVDVEDNGPGIPLDTQRRMFEPFFTTKPPGEGTGLGLDTCRRIIGRHDGLIDFQSEPGRTVFQVRLPVTGRCQVPKCG